MSEAPQHYTAVVIGSGFGGTMTALPLARFFAAWNRDHPNAKRTILILERGTWWTTPVSAVQDKNVAVYDLLKERGQPVQHWSSQNHFRGFIDTITRCRRRKGNEDGLYDLQRLGTTGLWSLIRPANDGVSILRACGVGGGSLVYSNITIHPPELIFTDERWRAVTWSPRDRDEYFELAREAIGRGVLFALHNRDKKPPQAAPVNTGLSNIVSRTAGLDPHWIVEADALNPTRGRKRIDVDRPARSRQGQLPPGDAGRDPGNLLWLDRARVFQSAVQQLVQQGVADEVGAVDLAINDYDPADPSNQYDKDGNAKNYCERQGRCNVGCLPGARHTLNKQLMAAILGGPGGKPPIFSPGEIELWPLVDVDVVVKRPEGGYEVRFARQDPKAYLQGKRRRRWGSVTADIVIVAAGCLGTNEILLRSKERGTLPNLSDKVGYGFSTNGDYIAFMEKTKEHVSLIRGPVTTSFAHFNMSDDPSKDRELPAQPRFHTIEDQGIPPALASLAGVGLPLIRSLSKGRHPTLFLIWTFVRFGWHLLGKRLGDFLAAFFKNPFTRADTFFSEEEITAQMMCVVGMGREAAIGRFRLGRGPGTTPLRVRRDDDREFYEDPVYEDVGQTLERLGAFFEDPRDPKPFMNPFLTKNVFGRLKIHSITLTHPLGGCRIALDGTQGVVDEYGCVFDTSTPGQRGLHKGLYIADASIIPTALGVNPTLTISALCLRIADKLVADAANSGSAGP